MNNLNFLFYSLLSFSFSFRRKRKESDQRKQKETGAIIFRKFAQKHERILGCEKGCSCGHFDKNARKTLAFSGCLFRFSPDLMLWGVAGATRQYFMCEKPRACLRERVSACRSGLPRFFFLLSGASFLFLSQKKE
ncbi:MAG: hypothetical protein IJV70_04355 [Clostridia bacterium]|nr:hypothetical protein [Clostridia bacterium]